MTDEMILGTVAILVLVLVVHKLRRKERDYYNSERREQLEKEKQELIEMIDNALGDEKRR